VNVSTYLLGILFRSFTGEWRETDYENDSCAHGIDLILMMLDDDSCAHERILFAR
jgi:hypothetical protein